jgi:hypothetical protein
LIFYQQRSQITAVDGKFRNKKLSTTDQWDNPNVVNGTSSADTLPKTSDLDNYKSDEVAPSANKNKKNVRLNLEPIESPVVFYNKKQKRRFRTLLLAVSFIFLIIIALVIIVFFLGNYFYY